MKKILLPAVIAAVVFSNCSTAYKTGSTPDDVYYSPGAKAVTEASGDRYTDASGGDDNYLRMKVNNRYRWDAIDDYGYWNDSRYDFGYSCFPSREVLMNPYVPYAGWSFGFYYAPWTTFYRPYYTIVYYKNPHAYYGSTSKSNLTAYRSGNYYSPQGASKQSFGSLFKSAFSGNNSNYNYNNSSGNPTRSFNSGFTPSNNAGGRSGGFNSGGVSGGARPSRPPM